VNPQAVDRIRKILRERAEPPKKKPSTPALGLSNPYGLLPIHLRSELLPQLSVEDQVGLAQAQACVRQSRTGSGTTSAIKSLC